MKFNIFLLALGIALTFYTNVAKRLKLKVRKFYGLILTFAEVTEEKLLGGLFAPAPILNRVNPSAHDKILGATLNYFGAEIRVKFDRRYLKQEKLTLTHKEVVNIYNTYQINVCSYSVGERFCIRKFSDWSCKLTKSVV